MTTLYHHLPASKEGQGLIEVLTALAVVLLVVVALIKATTVSMKSSDFSKTQTQATSYAQEAIEWIRSERDRDWGNIADRATSEPGSKYCLASLDWNNPDSCGNGDEDLLVADSRFKREVTVKDVTGDRIEIEVIVIWQDASGEHQSKLTTYLSNWR